MNKEQMLKELEDIVMFAQGLSNHIQKHGMWGNKEVQNANAKAINMVWDKICDVYVCGYPDPDDADNQNLAGCPGTIFFETVLSHKPRTVGDVVALGKQKGYTETQVQAFLKYLEFLQSIVINDGSVH